MELVKTIKENQYTICQYKITDEKTLAAVKVYLSYDDEDKNVLQLGNVYIDLMYNNATSELMIGNVTDTESSSWELYTDQIKELFGDEYGKCNAAQSGTELEKAYEKAKDDLFCINWSETDGSDVKKILKSVFTRYRNHKPEIIEKFNSETSFNKFQKSMITEFLQKM